MFEDGKLQKNQNNSMFEVLSKLFKTWFDKELWHIVEILQKIPKSLKSFPCPLKCFACEKAISHQVNLFQFYIFSFHFEQHFYFKQILNIINNFLICAKRSSVLLEESITRNALFAANVTDDSRGRCLESTRRINFCVERIILSEC